MAQKHYFLGIDAVLSDGSNGQLVKQLQEALAGAGFSPGRIDGIYGPETKQAVIRFQNAKGITPDGIAGPQTWAALTGAPPSAPPPQPAAPAPIPSPITVQSWYSNPFVIAGIGGLLMYLLLVSGRK